MKFSEFKLNQNILKGVSTAGFKECLPVQGKRIKTLRPLRLERA